MGGGSGILLRLILCWKEVEGVVDIEVVEAPTASCCVLNHGGGGCRAVFRVSKDEVD